VRRGWMRLWVWRAVVYIFKTLDHDHRAGFDFLNTKSSQNKLKYTQVNIITCFYSKYSEILKLAMILFHVEIAVYFKCWITMLDMLCEWLTLLCVGPHLSITLQWVMFSLHLSESSFFSVGQIFLTIQSRRNWMVPPWGQT